MSDLPNIFSYVDEGPEAVAGHLRWCSDPGHAWLVVPMPWVVAIDVYLEGRSVMGKLAYTQYSYIDSDSGCAWLEEDIDAMRFLQGLCELLDLAAGARPEDLTGADGVVSHRWMWSESPSWLAIKDRIVEPPPIEDEGAFRRFLHALPSYSSEVGRFRWSREGAFCNDAERSVNRHKIYA